MSYFKLSPNGLNYAVREWGTLGNLRRIMARNDDRYEDWIKLGNRVLPNENPLVQFLLMFSVNVEWEPNYLINVIDTHIQQYASAVNFTSLYNRGKNHPLSLYPEKNHNTLLVVPFDKPSASQINSYFNNEINTLVPIFPIYTTDTKQRWNTIDLIDTKVYELANPAYTIAQIDVYALVIGYWRHLKRGVEWGNSPHGYLAGLPLMNFYLYHNELTNYNYLNGNAGKIEVRKGPFNLEPYFQNLIDYTDFKNRYLLSQPMKSFTNFVEVNAVTNISVDQSKMIFPQAGKSLFFVQMSWVWTIASLGMVKPYLEYSNFIVDVDGKLRSDLKLYYKMSVTSQENQIKDPIWRKHFSMLHEEVSRLK